MTWKTLAITLGAVSLMLSAFNFEIARLQQNAIHEMLATEGALLEDFAVLSKDIQALRRDLEERTAPHEALECRLDILMAAARSGWHNANRLMQTGSFRCAD